MKKTDVATDDTFSCAIGRLLEFLYGFQLLSNTIPCRELPLSMWSWDTKTQDSPDTHLANCSLCVSVSEPSEFAEANMSFTTTFHTVLSLGCPSCLSLSLAEVFFTIASCYEL